MTYEEAEGKYVQRFAHGWGLLCHFPLPRDKIFHIGKEAPYQVKDSIGFQGGAAGWPDETARA
jgi:hypothetical protein